MKNKLMLRLLSLTIALLLAFSLNAFATEKNYSAIVDDVIRHLAIYSRYEDVSQTKLYKAGLQKALEENPELYESVMKSILESIDEHSEFYNKDEALALTENISGTVIGIGITFQMCNEGVDVRSVIPDTPAAKGGLQVDDVIVSADGVNLSGMNSDTAASYIKGEEGSTVTLGISREGISNTIYVTLTREKIVGTTITGEIFKEGDKKLMYIKVYGFVENTASAFKEQLEIAKKENIKNLIIDLRDNGGGIFDQAISMADMLIPKGKTITTEDHKIDLLDVVYKATSENAYDFDIAVLVNENSASASEVLAAALYENQLATLIGTKTYGKGTIQTVANVVDGEMIKFTVGYYLTPKGNNINGIGIIPNVVVENSVSDFEIDKYENFSYTNTYDIGDKHKEIATAKELLKVWGLFEGEKTDEYDDHFKKAVFAFQTATGLYPYGVLDLTTQGELYNRLSKSKITHDDQLDAAFGYFEMSVNEK